ncbi:MAG: zinc-ribbon domain-containing protein, partial [Pseudomonadota bacterium]|nr:zinc-ribbon domain-containing protein [Pseudomonadota bacterium]
MCAGKQVMPGVNDLASTHPGVVAGWHPTKNDDLTPQQVTAGSQKEVWWVCEEGHEYLSAPYKRVAGRGCPVCSGHQVVKGVNDLATMNPGLASQWHPTLNTKTLSEVTISSAYVAWWVCEKNPEHVWCTAVYNRTRIQGTGCPECNQSRFVSKAETELLEFIESCGYKVEQSNRSVLKGQEIDLWVPDRNIGIEFNGLYWHNETAGKGKHYHEGKYLAAKAAGIQLLQIWEDDWNRNPDLIKRLLAHKLGVSTQPVVFARTTRVEVLTTGQAKTFLTSNHIQGFASGSYYLGLRDIETSTLVAVMVLKKEPGRPGTLNIIRYATSTRVPGGFTKLLKHAERTYTP